MSPSNSPPFWQALLSFLQERKAPFALAFSGGLDSRFLAHALQKASCDVILYHATGAHIPQEESQFALNWAQEHGFTVRTFAVDVSTLDHVQNNAPLRCYYCKKHLMALFSAEAKRDGRQLCDGTNADDLHAHRPGLQALQEAQVLSPLALCNLSKKEIRGLAHATGLQWPEQKASPCLLTRLTYGLHVEPVLLKRIDEAEEKLRAAGVQECRVRIRHTPLLPLIQMTPCAVQEADIKSIMAEQGFERIEILLEENLSGYFDRA